MKKTVLLLIFTLIFMACNSSELKISYVGNEGFLIEKGRTKILTDALFGEIETNSYEVPSDSLVELMRHAKAPFDNISLISVSHSHHDHFNAKITLDHLLYDPNTRCIAPEQAVVQLRELQDYKKVASRIYSLDLRPYSDTCLSLNGIGIRALRLAHSPYMETDPESGVEVNRHRHVENLGYLFKVGDMKIFHGGDSNPADSSEFVHFALQHENIDLAFLDRLFLFRGQTAAAIQENYIQAKHSIFMHISPANAPRIAPYFIDDSTATVFTAPMESVELNF